MSISPQLAFLAPVLAFFNNELIGFQARTKAFVFNKNAPKVGRSHMSYIEHLKSDNPLIGSFLQQIELSFTTACFDPEGYRWMNSSEYIIHKLEEAEHPPLQSSIAKIRNAQLFYKTRYPYLDSLTPLFMRKDKDFVLLSLQLDCGSLESAALELQDDPIVALAAFENIITELKFASIRLRSDPDFMVQAIKTHPLAINYAHASVIAHPKVVAALLPEFMKKLCFQLPELSKNYEFMTQAILLDGFALLRSDELLKPHLKELAHKHLLQVLNTPQPLSDLKQRAQFIIDVHTLLLLKKSDELFILAKAKLEL